MRKKTNDEKKKWSARESVQNPRAHGVITLCAWCQHAFTRTTTHRRYCSSVCKQLGSTEKKYVSDALRYERDRHGRQIAVKLYLKYLPPPNANAAWQRAWRAKKKNAKAKKN